MNVAIVGGGIVGLTTALQLKTHVRNCNVSVIATSYDHDIVSYVAAGLFRVGHSFTGPNEDITKQWIKNSYEYYEDICRNNESIHCGVGRSAVYMYANSSSDVVRSHLMEAVVPLYRRVTEDELNSVGRKWKYGSYFETLIIQNKFHLPWARNKLKESGTKLTVKKLASLKELVDDYDFIINCSGLGARYLCNDKKVVPIRGQVTRVNAPWVTKTYYDELDTYIIPGVDGSCTLGGTRNFESSRMEVCPYDVKSIRDRCENLVPSLKKAVTLDHKVGLRPHREAGVRVEIERISNDRRRAVVVHNYGHGGYGVTTAPGTAKYAVELVRNYHMSSGSKL